jgi:hypothetical protein
MRRLTPHLVILTGLLGLASTMGCSETTANVQSNDQTERIRGLNQLAREGTEEAEVLIEQAASHEDPRTAIEAVKILGRSPQPRAREALLKVVAEEVRVPVRREAVVLLGQLPKQAVRSEDLEVLRRVVMRDPDPQVRSDAAAALGTVGGLADVKLLVEVATTATGDGELVLQCRAVRAVEDLLDMGFKYDPKAPLEQRQEALARVREYAPAIAEKYMRYHPKGRAGP